MYLYHVCKRVVISQPIDEDVHCSFTSDFVKNDHAVFMKAL